MGTSQVFQRIAISIHALLAESDLAGPSGPAFLYNFYPRSPCGERPFEKFEGVIATKISIHALLAESDYIRGNIPNFTRISIHALLAESDIVFAGILPHDGYFYPRSPCGERPF